MLLCDDIQGCEAVDRAMGSHRGRECECEDAAGVEDGEVGVRWKVCDVRSGSARV